MSGRRGRNRRTEGRRLAGIALSSAFVLLASCASPPSRAPSPPAVESMDEVALARRVAAAKGWGWLVERLASDEVAGPRAALAFADPRVPAFEGLFFRVEPREPAAMYRAVLGSRSVASALACRDEFAAAFESAEKTEGVSGDVVAAILHVETRCGRNTGRSVVLYGLARLAMANEPENLERNVQRTADRGAVRDESLAERVRARAAVLDAMFYPEVRATFAVADRLGIDALDLLGSASGAFGNSQFLPTSYLQHGVDGDGDGAVDLFGIDDAAASTARFLAANGWRSDLTRDERRAVIWHYNRSDPYIDAVLGLADRLASARRAAR